MGVLDKVSNVDIDLIIGAIGSQATSYPRWAQVTGATFLVCYVFWYLSGQIASQYPEWQAARIKRNDLNKWRSNFVATIHSLAVGIMSTYFVYNYTKEKMFEGQRIYLPFGDGAMSEMCVALSNGYMLYDLISMIRLGLFIHPVQAARIHHVVVISCFSFALHHDVTASDGVQFSPILTLCLVCELSNCCLGAHKIIRWTGIDVAKSTIAVMLDALFILTCFFTRFLLHPFVVYKTWSFRDSVPAYAFYMSFTGIILISLLDFVLFYDFASSRVKIYLPKLTSKTKTN